MVTSEITTVKENRVNMIPQTELEDKLLGCLILQGLKIKNEPMPYYDMLNAQCFVNPRNAEIFRALQFMYYESCISTFEVIEIDLVNLRDEMIMRDVQDMFGGIDKMVEYLVCLADSVPDGADLGRYTYELLKRDSRRTNMAAMKQRTEQVKQF